MEPQTNAKSKFSAEFFFLSLGVLAALITSVSAFLNLVFDTLNKRFPDVLNASYQYGYSTYQYEGMRGALATLIIFFPVYLAVSYFWRKYAERGLGQIDASIRKWVIYIILFLASVVSTIDLVALVRYFISGEITIRFILKALTVLVVAALVGAYYIISLRNAAALRNKLSFAFGVASLVIVASAIVYSFMIMGSPAKQRNLRLDDRRVTDLQNIQYQVINYWQQKERLPENLEVLANPLTGSTLPTPPLFEKGEKYEYNAKSKLIFELCATFALPMPKGWQENGGVVRPYPLIPSYQKDVSISYGSGYGINESWDHQAGRACFERTIDPDIYPPYTKQKN